MDERGHNKCIGFMSDIDECYKFEKSLEEMNKYYGLDLKVSIVTSDINQTERERILREFADYKGHYIVCSVRNSRRMC